MLTALHQLIDERNDEQQAELLKDFSSLYYSAAPMEELLARSVEDLYGSTLSCWHLIQ